MLGLYVGFGLGEKTMVHLGETASAAVAGASFGLLIGAGLGLGQSQVLLQRGLAPRRWVLGSAAGGAVVMGLTMALLAAAERLAVEPVESTVIIGLIGGLALGLGIGLGQAFVLHRRPGVALAWAALVTVSMGAAMALGLPLSGEGRELLSLGVVGLTAAVATSPGLTWLAAGRRDPPARPRRRHIRRASG